MSENGGTCPECSKAIETSWVSCPFCGFQIVPPQSDRPPVRTMTVPRWSPNLPPEEESESRRNLTIAGAGLVLIGLLGIGSSLFWFSGRAPRQATSVEAFIVLAGGCLVAFVIGSCLVFGSRGTQPGTTSVLRSVVGTLLGCLLGIGLGAAVVIMSIILLIEDCMRALGGG